MAVNRVKEKYKIPYTLDRRLGDVKQAFLKNGDKGIDKEFSVRGMLTAIAATAVYIWLVSRSPWSNMFIEGSWLGLGLFTIGYTGVTYFSLREISVPGLYGYNVIEPLFRYVKRLRNRDIKTQSFSNYRDVAKFVGMVEPDSRGRFRFIEDGSYGMIFKISGTASNNTFSVDRQRTIQSFENFLRTLPNSATFAFITNTGGQKVDNQLQHLFDEFDTETDQNVLDYIAEEIRELGSYVQKNFVALHQYLLIRGDDLAALNNAVKMTRLFIDQGQLAITELVRPRPEDITAVLKPFYTGLTEHVNERYEEFKKKDNNQASELESAGSLTKNLKKGQRIKVRTKGAA